MELVKASYTVRHLTVMDSNSAWSRVLSRSLIVTWQTGTSRPRTTKSKHGKAPALEALTPPAWRRRRRSCVPQPPTRLWPLQGRSSMRLFSTAFCHVSDCSSLSERCWHAAPFVVSELGMQSLPRHHAFRSTLAPRPQTRPFAQSQWL